MVEIGLLSFGDWAASTYVLRVSCPPHTIVFFKRESQRDEFHFSSSALCDKDVNSLVTA